MINSLSRDFISILIANSAKYDVPFKTIKGLSESLIEYFFKLSRENHFSDDLQYNLMHVLSSSDNLDNFLTREFDTVFPEVINVANTEHSFAYFDFKKSLDNLITKFSSFDKICYSNRPPSSNISSFFSTDNFQPNTIFLNFFVDDFQLSNPLLSKKSLKNSLTAIYFRIITTDCCDYSSIENIAVLSLINSNVFKQHSPEIFRFLSTNINIFLLQPVNVTINQISKSLWLKVAFFLHIL